MDQNKFKDYFEEKAEKVFDKMEKTPAKKLIVTVLALVSFGVLTLGYLQIKTQLERPFLADRLIEDKAKIRGPLEFLEFYKSEQRNRSELLTLQQRDSDNDGLSDYQEIYIYRTNAYNNDTDSDGVSDFYEISANENPNCPQGQTCDDEGFILAQPSANTNTQEIDVTEIVEDPQVGLEQLNLLQGGDKEQLKTYFLSLSAQDFKNLLLQQGYTQAQVDAIPDEQLKQTIDQIINSL